MNVKACIKCKTPMTHYPEHSHCDRYEIITNYFGTCTVTIENKQYDMEENDILIVPPGAVHKASSPDTFMDFYIAAKHLDYDRIYMIKDSDNVILPLMELMYKAMLEKENNYSKIADSLLDTICAYLDKYRNANHKYPFVNSLKETILENFTDPDFRLSETMTHFCYNKDYLRRCFESDTGKTPLQYLTDLRINRAKMLLLQNDRVLIREIGGKCGFSDTLYFSVVFKKITGMSPEEYRKFHAT